MGSKIEPRILDASIALFSDYGYYGVTTRDIAKKAKVTEGSIYRLFASKENLFNEAIAAVQSQALDPAHFLLRIFEEQGKKDLGALTLAVVRAWYNSFPPSAARLLTQAYFADAKWRKLAYAPVNKIIEILASSIEREKKSTLKRDPKAVAQALIFSLLHLKITHATELSPKDETSTVDNYIHHWLQSLT